MRVRLWGAVILMLATSVGLSGCSVKNALDAKFTPKPTVITIEATVAAVGAPIKGKLAKGFPDNLPLWPNSSVAGSKATKTPQGTAYSAVLTTKDPFADVVAGVGEGLKQRGWKTTVTDGSTGSTKVSILMVSSQNSEGIITVSQATGKPVRIEYVVNSK